MERCFQVEKLLKFAYMHKVHFEGLLKPLCIKHSLKMSDIRLLLMLHINPNLRTAKEICEVSEMKRGNISVLIEALTEQDFIRQEVNPNDKRSSYLFLTERSAGITKEFDSIMRAYYLDVMHGITENELEFCNDVFTRMYDNVERIAGGKQNL